VRAGLRYAWADPTLRSTLFLVGVLGMFGFNFVVVLPLLARYDFGGGAGLYSLFTSLMAAGSLAGALIAASRVAPTRRRLVGSAGAFGALTLTAAVAPTVALTSVLLVGMGLAVMLFLATANTMLQLSSDPAMRGRVMALYGLVFLGSTPVGGPLLGWISGRWGARWGLGLGGVLSLAAALAAVSSIRARRGAAALAAADLAGPPDIIVAV
jgi:MFS family permease